MTCDAEHTPSPQSVVVPTDAQIDSAIKATEYKYFGDYEMSPEQFVAVDTLVAAAAELTRLREAAPAPSPQSVVVPGPLWMMHVIGPDDIYPAPDHATAVEWCAYLNREIAPKVPEVLCVAVPAIWTGTAEEHAEGLAEAIKGWAVPAAPAPSSLAGGEVKHGDVIGARLRVTAVASAEVLAKAYHPSTFSDPVSAFWSDIAALSPEAPAREGGGGCASDRWPHRLRQAALDNPFRDQRRPTLRQRPHENPV